jgi:hypothetical protein
MSVGKPFKLRLGGGHARTVTVDYNAKPEEIRNRLRLPQFEHAILLHAGADKSTQELMDKLEPTFREQLAPLASKYNIPMIDGGTNSGFVGMMGKARAASRGTFPLIGVTPLDNAALPNLTGEMRYALEQNHTHVVLVKGGQFGVESEILIGLGRAIARNPIALLINGGEIVRKEARMVARMGIPMLVMEGSGRLADELVTAVRKRETSSDILRETIQIGVIRTCTAETLIPELKDLLDIEDWWRK